MQVESVAECSPLLGAFCNTFDLHLAKMIIRLENQILVFLRVALLDRFHCICLLYVLYSIKVIGYCSKGGYCSIRWFITLFHSGATDQGGKFPYEDKFWPRLFEGLNYIIWIEKAYANIVSGGNLLENEKKSDQGKVMEFYFQLGKLRKI